jgi:hypothetical protein
MRSIFSLSRCCMVTLAQVACVFPLVNAAKAEYAIVFSHSTGAWGSSYGSRDVAVQKAVAIGACRRHTLDCLLLTSGSSGCVALATSGKGYGFSVGQSLGGAISGAMSRCIASNPAGCENALSF